MRHLIVTVLLLVTPAVGSAATDIYKLIVEGDLRQAADSLSSVSTASTRNGDLLFYAGLLETDGDKTIKFMQAALQASVSPLHREQIYLRMAQYYHINRDLDNLGRFYFLNQRRRSASFGRLLQEIMPIQSLASQGDEEVSRSHLAGIKYNLPHLHSRSRYVEPHPRG